MTDAERAERDEYERTHQVKWCGPCGEFLPWSEFYKNRNERHGLSQVCKIDMNYHSEAYRRKILETTGQPVHRRYKDNQLVIIKKWRAAHPDRVREYARNFYHRHKTSRSEV